MIVVHACQSFKVVILKVRIFCVKGYLIKVLEEFSMLIRLIPILF